MLNEDLYDLLLDDEVAVAGWDKHSGTGWRAESREIPRSTETSRSLRSNNNNEFIVAAETRQIAKTFALALIW